MSEREFDRSGAYHGNDPDYVGHSTLTEDVTREQRMGTLFSELGRTGWVFVCETDGEGELSATLGRKNPEETFTYDVFYLLTTPQVNNSGSVIGVKNWEFADESSTPGVTGPSMSYRGPFGDDFERAVPGMVRFGEFLETGVFPLLPEANDSMIDVLKDGIEALF